MATIKTFMEISDYLDQTNDIKEGSTGAVLTTYSGPPTGMRTIPSLVARQDLTIDYASVMFSFPLSREWGELALFLDPRIYLVVQGRTLSGDSKIVRIYNGAAPNNSLICVWDKYFGIIRARVPISTIKEFNYITYVGIVMTRKDGSDATGRIYKIGSLTDALHSNFMNQLTNNYSIHPINVSSVVQISQSSFLSGAVESPVTKTQKISHGVAIAPNTYTSFQMFNVYGINSENNGTRNSRFFNNAIYYQFPTMKLGGSFRRPDYVKIGNEEYGSTPASRTIMMDATVNEYTPSISFQHGGYEYVQDTENHPPQTLKRDNLFLTFTNDEEMSEFFDFEGERYRTKFNKYSNDKNSVVLDTNIINGSLQQHLLTASPYQLSSTEKKIIISTPEEIDSEELTITNSTTQDLPSTPNKFFTFKSKLYNIFTKIDEDVTIQLPLIDEYEYYFIGDFFSIQYPKNNIKNQSLKNKQLVVYSDSTLLDHFSSIVSNGINSNENSKIFDLSTFNFNSNIVKYWTYCKSYVPLKNNELDFVEIDNTGYDTSYFEYRNPRIRKAINGASIDITDEIYSYHSWEPWTILYSCSFPKPSQNSTEIPENTNIITDLKIQEGKLYYKINTNGLGDKNDKFSINQFINYGIDGKHPIGLSSFDRNKTLAIFIPTELIPDASSADGWTAVKIIGTGTNEDSVDTLKLFYTNINNAINAPDVSSLTIPADGLKLRLQYKDTVENYVIFDFIVGSAQVTVGSRPLGLRKHGIIVNPTSANEDLLPGIAEKIHVTLEGTATTGKAVQIIAHNNVGAELDTCNIEYRVGGNGEAAGFYFDEVNISELKTTTVTNTTNITNNTTNITKNTSDIAALIKAFSGYKVLKSSGVGSFGHNTYGGSDITDENKTINITFSENLPSNTEIICAFAPDIFEGTIGSYSFEEVSSSINGSTVTVTYNCTFSRSLFDYGKFRARVYAIAVIKPTVSIT